MQVIHANKYTKCRPRRDRHKDGGGSASPSAILKKITGCEGRSGPGQVKGDIFSD